MQKARGHCTNAAPTACRRTVSGSLSLPCSGCFPPFPHGTGPLSVFRECLALRDGPRGFRQDSSCPALLRWSLRFIAVTRTGLSPSTVSLSSKFWFPNESLSLVLQPRHVRKRTGLGSAPFARHYSGYRLFFLFLRVLRCFSSPGSLRVTTVTGLQPAGFPHSVMSGSIPVCRSPDLFAAYHVFLRLRIA